CWSFTFLSALEEFRSAQPRRFASTRLGRRGELEVYTRPEEASQGGLYQFEIHYDPAMNYLPFYMRRVSIRPGERLGTARERFVVKAVRTSAGAFVPTKVIEVFFALADFRATYPSYSHETVFDIKPPVSCSIFELTGVREAEGPVGIDRPRDAVLSTPGGVMSLKRAPSVASLDTISSVAGRKLETSSVPLPALDKEELRKYEKPRPSIVNRYTIGLMAGLLVLAVLAGWRVKL
ncbi:MAG: hypothetical protein ACP5XB_03965, partial [Isosphaeraceae bacterium]